MRHDLVVATGNRGKLAELRALLEGLPVDVRGVHEVLPQPPHVVEDGTTFEANARKKACTVAQATMLLTLADDSGLEVDALGGQPGVRSARYAHDGATDAENNAHLLHALEAAVESGAPGPARARFRCVLALVDPLTSEEPLFFEGRCEGAITQTPRGSGGFGYDPLFVVEGMDKTLAELSDDEKNAVSHRAKAATTMRLTLEKILAARSESVRRILAGRG